MGRRPGAGITTGCKRNPWEVEREPRTKLGSHMSQLHMPYQEFRVYLPSDDTTVTSCQLFICTSFSTKGIYRMVLLHPFYRWIGSHGSFALGTTAGLPIEAFKRRHVVGEADPLWSLSLVMSGSCLNSFGTVKPCAEPRIPLPPAPLDMWVLVSFR